MGIADRAVQIALGEVGKPYAEHRDCSGFTAWVARRVGVTIPEGSVAQFSVGEFVPTGPLQPGDLLFWDTFGPAPGHVAMYIGDQRFVHAFNEQKGISVNTLRDNMGGPYMGARRIFTEGAQLLGPTGKPDGDAGPVAASGDRGPTPPPRNPRKEQRKRERDQRRRRRK